MEINDDLSFNCAESVLLAVNKVIQIPNFDPSSMRIASLLGGGISGTGEICGALSGGIMCLGLIDGTDGTEESSKFHEKRRENRTRTQQFMKSFIDNWGSSRCSELIAMDRGELAPMGTKRKESSAKQSRCGDYIQWATDWIIEYLKQNPER
ncbi:MAG: C-GCAxxG-C-C family protein [Candidatus Thorarchaeota archaeon]|jgi:C_GCAxxG_C_C family probable redox protein